MNLRTFKALNFFQIKVLLSTTKYYFYYFQRRIEFYLHRTPISVCTLYNSNKNEATSQLGRRRWLLWRNTCQFLSYNIYGWANKIVKQGKMSKKLVDRIANESTYQGSNAKKTLISIQKNYRPYGVTWSSKLEDEIFQRSHLKYKEA